MVAVAGKIRSYEISGDFIEACDCFELCPCWVDDTPDEGHCTGLVAWTVTGRIDDVEIHGRHVVAVTGHGGGRREQAAVSVLFIDDRATSPEFDKLAAAFSGRDGGAPGCPRDPVVGALGELAEVTGQVVGAPAPSPIQVAADDNGWQIRVGSPDAETVTAAGVPLRFDGQQSAMRLHHTALHQELGITGEVLAQRSANIELVLPALPQGYLQVHARSGMRGRFSYAHS